MTKLETTKEQEVTRVTRMVRARMSHGCKPDVAVTIYSNGEIGLRERGRPAWTKQKMDIGQLYTNALLASARRADGRMRQLVKDGKTRKQARRQARRENGLGL